MPEPKKFKPEGKPLSDAEIEELAKIRVKDVKAAIQEASPELRNFLNADVRQQRK